MTNLTLLEWAEAPHVTESGFVNKKTFPTVVNFIDNENSFGVALLELLILLRVLLVPML